MTLFKPSQTAFFPTLLAFSALLCGEVCLAAPSAAPAVKNESAPEVAEKPAPAKKTEKATKPAAAPAKEKEEKKAEEKKAEEPVETQAEPAEEAIEVEEDAVQAENMDAEVAAVAKPVSADPVQIYGWREFILIRGVEEKLKAKLDTGALTSSIHAEEKELFERDGKKWVRFIVTDPSLEKPTRTRIEAPLIRTTMIKEPNSPSVSREVVRLSFQIGDRKLNGEFTLNNRSNMLAPVLVGRRTIKELGLVDPGRTNLADEKIFR